MEQPRIENNLSKRHEVKSHYPDFRFMCPDCGSLEIYFSGSELSPKLHCLDCGTN